MTDVCYAVGFHDHSYFTRTFRKVVGCTPSSYVRSVREGARTDAASRARTPEACPLPAGVPPPESTPTGLWAEVALPPGMDPAAAGAVTADRSTAASGSLHRQRRSACKGSSLWETCLLAPPEEAGL